MSNIARGILIMVIAFKFYHIKIRRHSRKVTRAMIEGHLLMRLSIVMELAALVMELLKPACGPAILMMIAGTFVFGAGRAAYTGKDGTGEDIL